MLGYSINQNDGGNIVRRLLLLALSILMLGSNLAFAGNHAGRIDLYHLHSSYAASGRGVCIRMSPSLPETGWACLWKNNGLYTEITDLLLEGFSKGRNCTVEWHEKDGGNHPIIYAVECR